jgi:hypothetical protein
LVKPIIVPSGTEPAMELAPKADASVPTGNFGLPRCGERVINEPSAGGAAAALPPSTMALAFGLNNLAADQRGNFEWSGTRSAPEEVLNSPIGE